jgi:hypothetical protein
LWRRNAPVEEFQDVAANYPVFEVISDDGH